MIDFFRNKITSTVMCIVSVIGMVFSAAMWLWNRNSLKKVTSENEKISADLSSTQTQLDEKTNQYTNLEAQLQTVIDEKLEFQNQLNFNKEVIEKANKEKEEKEQLKNIDYIDAINATYVFFDSFKMNDLERTGMDDAILKAKISIRYASYVFNNTRNSTFEEAIGQEYLTLIKRLFIILLNHKAIEEKNIIETIRQYKFSSSEFLKDINNKLLLQNIIEQLYQLFYEKNQKNNGQDVLRNICNEEAEFGSIFHKYYYKDYSDIVYKNTWDYLNNNKSDFDREFKKIKLNKKDLSARQISSEFELFNVGIENFLKDEVNVSDDISSMCNIFKNSIMNFYGIKGNRGQSYAEFNKVAEKFVKTLSGFNINHKNYALVLKELKNDKCKKIIVEYLIYELYYSTKDIRFLNSKNSLMSSSTNTDTPKKRIGNKLKLQQESASNISDLSNSLKLSFDDDDEK